MMELAHRVAVSQSDPTSEQPHPTSEPIPPTVACRGVAETQGCW